MAITATLVKELREKTGVGMMECKKALEENSGDMEKSILWLRERGMSRAAKKADRIASEGIVTLKISKDGHSAILLEINCETDFVSKNPDFQKFTEETADAALKKGIKSVDDLPSLKLDSSGVTIEHALTELIQKIGENMKIRRLVNITAPNNGLISGYVHMGGRIGTLICLEGLSGAPSEQITELGKDLAMHVAAAAPRYLNSEEVDRIELNQERDLARKKLIEEKKPEAMIEKILEGQMKKFFKEVCLIEQPFVKEPEVTVSKYVERVAQKTSPALKIKQFVRFQLGEGIEKKNTDFAAEVASQLR